MADALNRNTSDAAGRRVRDMDAEKAASRRIRGIALLVLAILPYVALATYDWRDIAELCIPPNAEVRNLVGALGARFAYRGYAFAGLAVWAVPVLMTFCGLILVCARPLRIGRRALAMSLLMLSGTALLQSVGDWAVVKPLLDSLNIAPNAGGDLGYLVMTRWLVASLGAFGATLVAMLAFLTAIVLLAGVSNIAGACEALAGWVSGKSDLTPEEIRERRERREAEAAAARLVREEARAAREEEKRKIAEERERAKLEKEAIREKARAEREAEREKARAEREAQRSAIEAVKEAAQREREEAKKRLAEGNARAPQPPPAVAGDATDGGEAAEPDAVEEKPPVPYELPQVDLLQPVPESNADHGDVDEMVQKLIDTLRVFDINATLAYTVTGPVVTQYALQPELGVRVERIAALANNLKMALKAKSLRIQAPIPGEDAVGIEVPNKVAASVSFRDVVESKLWREKSVWPQGKQPKFHLPLLLGKDSIGNDLVVDLAKIPHLLVAGATGQGKSVCLNSIINGFLMCRTPEQLKLIMVDPKRVEFTSYARLPHLLVPVVTDTKKVVFVLRQAMVEMDKRLAMLQKSGCKNIVEFNTRKIVTQLDAFGEDKVLGDADLPRTLPYLVIIIDELADIMLTAGKDVEPVIARLLALARATGIHLILATQRPDTKVITGTLKANIPGRIAFKTSQGNDSRTILDSVGAETLIGKGDMLMKTSDGNLLRAQGSYISNEDIDAILNFIGERFGPQFDENLTRRMERIKEADPDEENGDEESPAESPVSGGDDGFGDAPAAIGGGGVGGGVTQSKDEQLYTAALDVLRRTGRASTSHLQRRMNIGYNHAARVIDMLEERGIIGPSKGAGPRDILVDLDKMLATDAELNVTQTEPEEDALPPSDEANIA